MNAPHCHCSLDYPVFGDEEVEDAFNANARLATITMLKSASREWRETWAERLWEYDTDTQQSIPVVGLHPDVGINKGGRVINTKTGRYI